MSIRDAPAKPSVERRRKPDVARREAIAAGRRLLIAGGPGAVTLKAVGAEVGMSHANLIHHFGSAEAFQGALKDDMVLDLTRRATSLLTAEPLPGTAAFVDEVFEAYDAGGIGILMAWSTLAHAAHDEAGMSRTVGALVAALGPRLRGSDAAARARTIVSLVTLLAFADAVIGASLAGVVGLDRAAIRELTVKLVDGLADGPTDGAHQAR